MANVQQITRDYLLRARTEGVAATTAAAQQLGAATDTLATKTETVTRSQISAATALDRLQRQLDMNYRSAKQFETAQRDLNRAQEQGLISTARHAELMALATQRSNDMGKAANDNNSALERLGNTLTRRVIFAFLIREVKEAISVLFNLNTELARTGDIASRIGAGSGSFQGLDFAATIKGVKDFPGAMLKFNDEVAQARLGLGDLGTLFRANNIQVKGTEDAFLHVADLVKNAATESQKFSILQQAGLSPTREMVRLMEQGAPALRKQAEEAHKFTNEQLRQAQELDDLWNKMWAGFTRGAKSAFLEVSTFVDKLNSAANKVAMIFSSAVPTNLLKSAFDKERTGFGASGTRLDQTGADSFYNTIPVFKQPAGDGSTKSPATEKELLALETRRIGILGQMATVTDIVTAKQRELNQAGVEGVGITRNQIAFLVQKLREDELGITALKSQADASRIEAATVGLSIEKATTLRAMMALEAQDRINGRVVTEAETAARLKNAEAAGAQVKATELAVALDQAQFDAKTALLSPLEKEIALLQKRNGINPQTDEIASLKRMTDGLKTAQDSATQFTTTLVDGLMDGKNVMQTLTSAVDQLAKSLMNSAIKDLMSGNWEKAAVEAIAAITIKLGEMMRNLPTAAKIGIGAIAPLTLLGSFSEEPEDKALTAAKQAWADMNKEMQAFIDTSNGFDFSGPASQLQSLREQYDKFNVAAFQAHDPAGQATAFDALAKSARRVVDAFANADDSLSEGAKQIGVLKQQAAGLVEYLNRNGGMELNAQVFAGLARQIAAIQATIAKGLTSDVNSAQGKGFLNDLTDLITKRNQLLAEGNVSSGQVSTWFDAMTQKVVDDAGLVGDSFNDLLKTFPDLTGVVHESTDALQKQADTQAQLMEQQKEAYKSLSKDINDFITSLKFGDKSTLSKSEQFSAAQSDFAAQSKLALGGDQAAQSSITKYADTYLTQARSYLGPSAAFGSISDQVVAALQQILSANKPAGMRDGGLVGGYAMGGLVTNGLYNVDSVLARYAGGGQIALAGREYVMPAPQTAANFGTLEAMRAGRGPANDNGAVVAELRAMRADYGKVMSVLNKLLYDANMTDEQLLAEIKGLRSDQRSKSGSDKVRAKVAANG